MRFIVALFFLILPFTLTKTETKKPRLCLNMIVKNESKVIRRCLDSVKGIIDYWVIVDTGSTDGTQGVIREHLKGIPGELYERPWKNFGESRSEAFDLVRGKGEYILFMDADDVLEIEEDFSKDSLELDQYNLWRGSKGFTYLKPQIVKGDLPWRWVGVTHEYLTCDQLHTSGILNTVRYLCKDGGARSGGIKKFLHNIDLLTEGLQKEPDNSRYVFYLAESYRDAGEKGKALEWYQKRINMGGWEEEVFWSKLQTAHLLRDLGFPPSLVIKGYELAHNYRPHRIEPVYYLAEYYNGQKEYALAYALLKLKTSCFRKDILFNEDWIYDYGFDLQLSISAYYVGNYQESLDLCDKLLAINDISEGTRQLVMGNRTYPLAKLSVASQAL